MSGVPGTGKTATVLEVVRSLKQQVEAEELPKFHFVEINSLGLPAPQHAYSHLFKVCSVLRLLLYFHGCAQPVNLPKK